MTGTGAWLDERSPGMPVELRLALDAALAGGPEVVRDAEVEAGGIADRLAAAGLAALARSIRGTERSTATDLLVADALLTYACEAAAEAGPAALDRLTAGLDFERFATLLEPSAQ